MNKTVSILLPLDVLLDTRIATVAKMDEKLATETLSNGYHKRRSDFYRGVDKLKFDEEYKKRDESTLARARVTNIVFFLKEMIESLVEQAFTTPSLSEISIDINIHPYTISSELADSLVKAVRYWTIGQTKVQTVSFSDEVLAPQFIKGKYDILFRYHYAEWLEMHTDNFAKCQLTNVNLYVPAISFTQDLSEGFLRKLGEKGRHPLNLLMEAMAPFITLTPLDATVFSVINPSEL